jgi:hypothetical protein
MLLVGIFEARTAPPADPKNAGTPIAISTFGSGFICLRYKAAAVVVPNTADYLLVPSTSAVSDYGNPIKSAGSWINPPPPAMESTKPAKKDAASRKIPVAIEIS